jgi:hypothetical protein
MTVSAITGNSGVIDRVWLALGDTPSKIAKPRNVYRHSFPLASTSTLQTPDKDGTQNRRLFERSPPIKAHASVAKGNATFLTECSFGVAHDKLVQIITDEQPYEPYWESLSSIKLSQKNLESTARLKEFLPNLVDLNLLVISISRYIDMALMLA